MTFDQAEPPHPGDAAPDPETHFRSLFALRAAHTDLLSAYSTVDDERLPEEFVEQLRTFLRRGAATGGILDADEDRSEAQTLLNYWTTVLYAAGKATAPAILAPFDAATASATVGDSSPYRGLSAFDRSDQAVFYGRGRLVRRMAEWLEHHRFLAVVGLSGSGKSSLVRAGLMPALAQGAVQGSEQWRLLEPMVPGSDPLANLAAVTLPPGQSAAAWREQLASDEEALVGHLAAGPAVLLVVDQFEELFTIAQPEQVRHQFIAQLVRLLRVETPRHSVVVTLRTDFQPYLARYESLAALFQDEATVHVPPLDVSGLRAAIEKPAARRGVRFEPGLIEELVQEVVGEPAGLPLLQFTLLKLWEHRSGNTITRAAYKKLGGSVRDILARSATETYENLPLQEDREIVEEIFRRLVTFEGTETTSRRVRLADLKDIPANQERVTRVIDLLVAAGLVRLGGGAVAGDDQLEVTHEALIRNWALLGEWLKKDREQRRQRALLTAAAQWWDTHKREPGALLRGARLEAAEQIADLTDLERQFVGASRGDVEQSRRRFLTGLVTGLLIVVLLLAAALVQSWRVGKATSERDTAERAKDDAQRERDTAQRAKLDAERQLAEVSLQATVQRFREVNNELTIAESKLAEVQRKLKEAAEASDRATQEADQATREATRAKEELEQRQRQLQAIEEAQRKLQSGVRRLFDERPAIPVTRAGLGDVPPSWRRLQDVAPAVSRNSAAVGLYRTADGQQIATAFLVGPDLAITFASSGAIPRGGEIDFSDQPSADSPLRFAVSETVAVDTSLYAAIVRLRRLSTAGRPLPPPLRLASQSTVKSESPVYVIGFPMEDSRTPKEVSQAVFGGRFGIKRVQPGYILSVAGDRYKHDCFSTGGSAGSPVIDLASGLVIGLHYAGQAPSLQGSGIKYAIGSWALLKSPQLRRAALKYE